MSLSFFVNNFHFAFELVGAVALLMAAWLTFDTYAVKRDTTTLVRAIGFTLFAVWQTLYAVQSGDVFLYVGFTIFLVGLVCIAGSFLTAEKLQVQAVVVLPAFTAWSGALDAAAALLLFTIALLSYQQSRREHNPTWRFFTIGFGLVGLAYALGITDFGLGSTVMLLLRGACEVIGFICIACWVWQFLALRIRESLVLILIAAALFLSTLVTLAFSTILISQVATETDASLKTDVRVLQLVIEGLSGESGAKAKLIAENSALVTALQKDDFVTLEQLAETALEDQKLGFVTIVDAQGSVLVRAHALSRKGDSLFEERAVEEALKGSAFTTIESSPVEKLSIRSSAPLLVGGTVRGVVVVGYPLDNAFVDNIKRITSLDMFVYEGDTSIAATAFALDGHTRLTGVALSGGLDERVLTESAAVTAAVDMKGQVFRASYLPLKNGDGKVIGMIAAAKPEQDILDVASATNRLTLITIIIIMLALAYPIYFFSRRFVSES